MKHKQTTKADTHKRAHTHTQAVMNDDNNKQKNKQTNKQTNKKKKKSRYHEIKNRISMRRPFPNLQKINVKRKANMKPSF
jgi:hypothetical protein